MEYEDNSLYTLRDNRNTDGYYILSGMDDNDNIVYYKSSPHRWYEYTKVCLFSDATRFHSLGEAVEIRNLLLDRERYNVINWKVFEYRFLL